MSLASFALVSSALRSSSSTLGGLVILQLYHSVPWGPQGPMQIQQNSWPQPAPLPLPQVMCRHPSFFSIGRLQDGQGLALARIHCISTASSSACSAHLPDSAQVEGPCHSLAQEKHQWWPHSHAISRTVCLWYVAVRLQPGAGQLRTDCQVSWRCCVARSETMAACSAVQYVLHIRHLIRSGHAGQRAFTTSPGPSASVAARWERQQAAHSQSPQGRASASL
mmetsp:Transcript_10263/g.39901  ORF Transcript_10263/g.39901 Transcript_10263/m.39901 type:complete len:222 (+) Transcript_10263:640-1305(+)